MRSSCTYGLVWLAWCWGLGGFAILTGCADGTLRNQNGIHRDSGQAELARGDDSGGDASTRDSSTPDLDQDDDRDLQPPADATAPPDTQGDAWPNDSRLPDSGCVPSCSGKQCGDDGCGGSCPKCATGRVCSSKGQCVPPNIVLVLLDDADYRDIGVYNPKTNIPTPQIDAFAKQGIRFTRYYSSAPSCSPTRSSILSGNYPARYGITVPFAELSRRGLPGTVRTLAEFLKSEKYVTAHVGKWHLGEHKSQFRVKAQGFDHSVTGPSRILKSYVDTPLRIDDQTVEPPNGEHMTKRLTDHAMDFVTRQRNAPFFLNLWYYSPHRPVQPPADWAANYPDDETGKFAALLSYTDHQIGRLLDHIDSLGIRDRTAVLVVSDNGGIEVTHTHHGSALRGYKGELFEGGIRSPLMIRWPGLGAKGSTVQAVTTAMDLLPTIAEMLGRDPKSLGTDGQSAAAVLRGASWQREGATFWQTKTFHPDIWTRVVIESPEGYLFNFAVREGRWKLVMQNGALRLFDLDKDAAEKTNLRASQAAVVGRLLDAYDDWRLRVSRFPAVVHATLGGVTTVGQRFTFSGQGEVEFANSSLVDFHDGDFSCRFRLKPGNRAVDQRIIGKGGSWRLRLTKDKVLQLRINGPGGVYRELSGKKKLQADSWYDIAVSFYGGAKGGVLARAYLDGVKEIEIQSTAVVEIDSTPDPVKLSTNQYGSWFGGQIEKVAFYATSLTRVDLQQ